jgi:hypothetical protein|tara:strand:- start:825 stop:941 length:117 start_codon:yes stop_codon:yes gene_type:complete
MKEHLKFICKKIKIDPGELGHLIILKMVRAEIETYILD